MAHHVAREPSLSLVPMAAHLLPSSCEGFLSGNPLECSECPRM